jgi:hypothetical protein
MASTVDRLAQAAALLVERGVPVEEYGAWRTRGAGPLRPEVHVEHCTSDPAPLPRGRMLDLLARGHGSLTNALCTWAVPRDRPAAVLISARTAWHAGQGSWQGVAGNAAATGTEIQRAQGQQITDAQWEVAAEITAATVEVFGIKTAMVCTHNEWTPRKVDPHGLDGADWRPRVQALLDRDDDHQRDQEDETMPKLLRLRANENVRLSMAAAAGTVAGYRAELGLPPEPASDMVWARRIRKGSHDVEDAYAALLDKAG